METHGVSNASDFIVGIKESIISHQFTSYVHTHESTICMINKVNDVHLLLLFPSPFSCINSTSRFTVMLVFECHFSPMPLQTESEVCIGLPQIFFGKVVIMIG